MIQNDYFLNLVQSLQAVGISVFWGELPGDSTPYPFVFLDEPEIREGAIKAGRTGTLYQTVHVWHDKIVERGTLMARMELVYQMAALIGKAGNYGLMLTGCNRHVIYDDTTKSPLLHGVVELTYNFS